jgi:sodium/potassium/calcium exchanger 6
MVITVACIHLICYKAASPLRLQQQHQLQRQQQQDHQVKVTPPSTDSIHHHSKRWIVDDSGNDRSSSDGDDQGGALLHWQQYWQAATRQQKPFLFAGMILWLFFLFAFVGITASDFFCPNLSTIASRLGMSESVVSESMTLSPRARPVPSRGVS